MITNWRDAVAFVFYAALLPLFGIAVLGGPIWPLVLWAFLAMLGWVGKQAPQPVRHDLGLPDRTLRLLDTPEASVSRIHRQMIADGLIRGTRERDRLGDAERAA
jgi:hypothetical protein